MTLTPDANVPASAANTARPTSAINTHHTTATPQVIILVALVTPGAMLAGERVAEDLASFVGDAVASFVGGTNANGEIGHSLFHLFWALLAIAIAFALYRFRRAWLATGWTERCLAAAYLLVRGIAVGNVLAAVGAAIPFQPLSPDEGLWVWRLDYVLASIFHDVGEVLAVGSLLILLPVCLVMLGVGVRGALRPMTAQPS